jgi:hypothetical protein
MECVWGMNTDKKEEVITMFMLAALAKDQQD